MNVALVTGGARGIGFGCARLLAEAGWHVVVLTLPGDETAPLQALGETVTVVAGDVTDAASRAEALDACERLGGIGLLVNNAGIAPHPRRDVLEMDMDSYERVLAVNLRAPVELSIEAARRMLAAPSQHRRTIVNITSANARMTSNDRAEYTVSKAGLAAATRVLAQRLAGEGVDVFEVVPGIIATEMTAVVRDKYAPLVEEGRAVPSRRWGTPDDVGRAVVALASGALPYSPGQTIFVDGGLGTPTL